MGNTRWAGVWRLVDPKLTLAFLPPMLVGAAAAARQGPLAWGWLAASVGGIFLLEVAKNASGEIVDFDSGADLAVAPEDRTPFSGGKRVLVDGLLTRGQTAAVAAAGYLLAGIVGALIAWAREPRVVGIGLAGAALAFFYHAPPLRLSYRGLGEVAVGVVYGPLLACGIYVVQRGDVPAEVAILSLPLGLLGVSFLWLAEFPDERADRSAGKRTLVVRLGRARAARVYPFLVAAALVGQALLPLAGFPRAVWLGLLALPFCVGAAVRVLRAHDETARLIPAIHAAWLSIAALATGTAVGLLVG